MASRKHSYRVETKKSGNKKLAIRLLISLIVIMSVYFGCIKAGAFFVQDVYIYGGFLLAVAYIFFSVRGASEKEKATKQAGRDVVNPTAQKWIRASKYALILLIPILFSLLLDYMLIVMGLAEKFGI